MLRTLFGLSWPVRRIAQVCAAAALGLVSHVPPMMAQDVPVTIPVLLQNAALDGHFTSGGQTATTTVAAGRKFGAWTVELGNIGLHVNEFSTPGGIGNVVDLNGNRSGSISQTIDTIGGAPYTVSFLMSGNWTTNPTRPRGVTVRLGTQRVSFTQTQPVGWSKANPVWELRTAQFTGAGGRTALRFSSDSTGMPDGAIITAIEVRGPIAVPGPLSSVPVPTPPNLADFVQDREKAIALGKAFFWDMQAGSDGRTACATCHWHAGADVRTGNMFHPGAPGSAFGPQRADSAALNAQAASKFRGAGKGLTAADFPSHKVTNRLRPKDAVTNPVIADSMEVVGSEGVISQSFLGITEGSEVDLGQKSSNPLFESGGASLRQTTGRNSPSAINAVFHDRTFWDGRANRFFNGVNEFGDLDPNARVLRAAADGSVTPVRVLLDNGTLASQAVGPVGSHVEMSWLGRSFPDVGRKLLSLRPLAQQRVAADDSVLGIYRDASGKGLDSVTAGYATLIRSAFRPEWWSGTQITADGYTQMEANFALFWGLSVMLYEATLVSDQTPFDRFAQGDVNAMTERARVGLSIFMKEGRCIDCHTGPEFAGATVGGLRPLNGQQAMIETMAMVKGTAFYDIGFYNIGVRPTAEDLGIGASHPVFGPLSYVRQEQAGRDRDARLNISPRARVTADGAFKSPTLRNVELTGPYMHNGSMKSLTEVMEFYTRGADFFHQNIDDMAPGMHGIPALQNNPEGVAAVVEFMLHLTDERVRVQSAPFDHPELLLPNGPAEITPTAAMDKFVRLPETGRSGGVPFTDFETVLANGLGLPAPLLDTPAGVAPLAAATLAAPAEAAPALMAIEPLAAPTEGALAAPAAVGDAPLEAAAAPEVAPLAVDAEIVPPEAVTEEAGAGVEETAVLPVAEDAAENPVDTAPVEEPVALEAPGTDPVAEEAVPVASEGGSRESISRATPGKEDVLESKKHLLDRKVKPAREQTPAEGNDGEGAHEEPVVGEEPAEEPAVEEEEAAEEEEMTEEPVEEEVAEEEAHEEEAAEEPAEEEETAEEVVEEEDAAEEAVEEEATEEEEMTEEVAEEEVAEEEAAVEEEEAVEEPVAEEPEAGDEGDHSNSEPISLPTPDADDVPENKKHLIDRNVKPPREEAPEEGAEEEAHEEEVTEEPAEEEEAAEELVEEEEAAEEAVKEEVAAEEPADEDEAAEEVVEEEESAEEAVEEEDAADEEEMTEEPAEEEVAEEEAAVEEEEAVEEPVAEEPEAGDEGDHSNREPISLPTPDADDVPENKKHLIDRNVKPPREEAPEEGAEEEAHEEEAAEEPAEEEETAEEVVEEEEAAEEAVEEEEATEEEEMTEESAEEEAAVEEEEAAEEVVEEEESAEEAVEEEDAADEEEMTEEPAEEEVVEEEEEAAVEEEEAAVEEEEAAEEEMTEEPAEEEVVEEETPVEEEEVTEEPVAEEPEAGEAGGHSNREPISLPTPDADDVPENKLHLIDRNVKPAREEAPDEEPVVEEEVDGSGVGSDKQHLLGRQLKSPRTTVPEPALAEELPEADRVMQGVDPAGIAVAPVDEEIVLETETVIEEILVAAPEEEIAEPEITIEAQMVVPIEWFCVLPTPFSIGVLGFPVDENGNPIVREGTQPDVPVADPGVSDEELVTVTGVPAVDPKEILVGRSVKPAPLPVDPSQPSPKGILLQRKPKIAPATVE